MIGKYRDTDLYLFWADKNSKYEQIEDQAVDLQVVFR